MLCTNDWLRTGNSNTDAFRVSSCNDWNMASNVKHIHPILDSLPFNVTIKPRRKKCSHVQPEKRAYHKEHGFYFHLIEIDFVLIIGNKPVCCACLLDMEYGPLMHCSDQPIINFNKIEAGCHTRR